jgi:hypothetical protein
MNNYITNVEIIFYNTNCNLLLLNQNVNPKSISKEFIRN